MSCSTWVAGGALGVERGRTGRWTLLGRRCSPRVAELEGEVAAAGHKIGCAASNCGMLWFCHTCGRYGVSRTESLRTRCQGFPLDAGRSNLRRLAKGSHPVKRKGDVVVLRGWASCATGRRVRG